MQKHKEEAPAEDSERRGRFAVGFLTSLLEEKRIGRAYGDTLLKLVWKEGELTLVDITDHTTYK
jgi:hypothetical protein